MFSTLIPTSVKFVPLSPVDNTSLVQVTVWRRSHIIILAVSISHKTPHSNILLSVEGARTVSCRTACQIRRKINMLTPNLVGYETLRYAALSDNETSPSVEPVTINLSD